MIQSDPLKNLCNEITELQEALMNPETRDSTKAQMVIAWKRRNPGYNRPPGECGVDFMPKLNDDDAIVASFLTPEQRKLIGW